jgi:hypothetical protein
MDLFRRLLPATWEWAVLQAARETARREDARLRRQDHDPDRIISLYNLGFEIDERLDERLQDLKRSRRGTQDALPGLVGTVETVWDRNRFSEWVAGHGRAETLVTPAGRRIKGDPPDSLDRLVRKLVSALIPLGDVYPLPHYWRPRG